MRQSAQYGQILRFATIKPRKIGFFADFFISKNAFLILDSFEIVILFDF